MTFASGTINSRTQPVVTFVGTDLPSGTVLYLQRGSAAGTNWQDVARTAHQSGTAKIPADQPASYQYRMIAIDHGKMIATSANVPLTVTGPPGSCTICKIGHDIIPWLKLLEQPVLGYVVAKVLDWLWSIFSF